MKLDIDNWISMAIYDIYPDKIDFWYYLGTIRFYFTLQKFSLNNKTVQCYVADVNKGSIS